MCVVLGERGAKTSKKAQPYGPAFCSNQCVRNTSCLLHEQLLFVAGCAGRGELDGVEIEDGSLYIARTKPTVPDASRLLAGRLYGMLPRVRVTEVMGDVARLTGFTDCFTHLRTGYPASDVPALLAAILADGTNLGLSRMADATRGLRARRTNSGHSAWW